MTIIVDQNTEPTSEQNNRRFTYNEESHRYECGCGWSSTNLKGKVFYKGMCPECGTKEMYEPVNSLPVSESSLQEGLVQALRAGVELKATDAKRGWWLGEECRLGDLKPGQVFDDGERWYVAKKCLKSLRDNCSINHKDAELDGEYLDINLKVRPVLFATEPCKVWRYGEWTTVGELQCGAWFETEAKLRFTRGMKVDDYATCRCKNSGHANIALSTKCREIILEG